jgi:hypothetical protein
LRKFSSYFAQTSDGIIGAEKTGTKMNLQPQAENEPVRRTRSKLEAHREAIFALRRKHWTYGQIAAWLNERGVQTTLTSVYRFCERAIARRPRSGRHLRPRISLTSPARKTSALRSWCFPSMTWT